MDLLPASHILLWHNGLCLVDVTSKFNLGFVNKQKAKKLFLKSNGLVLSYFCNDTYLDLYFGEKK